MTGRFLLNLALTAVLAGLIGMHWLILPDPSRRNAEFLPDMVESKALDAQAPAPGLDGVPVDLRPPAGSIARGFMPVLYAATAEGARAAGEELENPFTSDDPEAVERGAFVYATFCSVCHGAGGHGDGNVTTRGVPPPPSLLADNALKMGDGRIFHLITFGQGNMASYASQVEKDDRWKVILHIRNLQQGSAAP